MITISVFRPPLFQIFFVHEVCSGNKCDKKTVCLPGIGECGYLVQSVGPSAYLLPDKLKITVVDDSPSLADPPSKEPRNSLHVGFQDGDGVQGCLGCDVILNYVRGEPLAF